MKKQILAKVSPWLLAAACAFLALIIGVFAVNNYQREKKLMSEALLQQGLTIVRFVMSSSISSMRGSLRNIHVAMWQWTDHVQVSIDNSASQPGVVFLGLLNPEGLILASSNHALKGDKIDQSTLDFLKGLDVNSGMDGTYRFKKDKHKIPHVFQVATLYFPFGQRNFVPRINGRGFSGMPPMDEMRMLRGRGNRKAWEQFKELSSKKYILLVELDLNDFRKAVRRQLVQILSLSFVLLLVGLGGWLSLLTLQGLKGSQSRLRQIREFTDILVSTLPIGLIATGDDGKVRIINTAAEEMVGVDSDAVIGKDPHEVLPVKISGELQNSAGSAGEPYQKEINLNDMQNRSRSLLTVALPVVDSEKKYAGNTLLIQDLSQIKDLQKELRRNERLAALGKMAAGVAHELRNPLSSIKGLALLLKTKLHDAHGTETADILVQEVERLNRSIGELLDYARPQKLQLEKINICEILNKSVTLIAADVESYGVSLNLDCEETYFVNGDKDKLNQVFLNLFLNSIQAMEKGGTLSITTRKKGNWGVCQVEDTGCGLEQESIHKVFDPYFTTKSGGTGLGLAMSAKIVEEHNGTIEFRSDIDSGTIVKVNLPVYSEVS